MVLKLLVNFRADASVQIGTGHVMRCLTLAEEFRRQGHQCRFICRAHEGHLGEFIISRGFGLDLLENPATEMPVDATNVTAHAAWLGVGWEQDAKEALEVLARHSADWLVVDHYALDARWEREVALVVGQILVIDDLADRDHECAVLLDQNLGREASDYDQRVPDECIRMIGPRFALLRPEFARLRESSSPRQRNSKPQRILISLGGVDRANATGLVLTALSETILPPETELDIVMGGAAPYLEEVRQQALQPQFKALVSVNVQDMAARMRQADFSIGAAGSTSWERCCLGLPSITVILAENQRLIGEALEKKGCAILVEERNIAKDLSTIVNRLMTSSMELEKLANSAENVCDGYGCARLVTEMMRKNRL